LLEVNPGFNPDNLLTAGVRLPGSRYVEDSQINAFSTTLVERVERLPGVVSAATVNSLPVTGFQATTAFYIEGRPRPASMSETMFAGQRVTSPGYFRPEPL